MITRLYPSPDMTNAAVLDAKPQIRIEAFDAPSRICADLYLATPSGGKVSILTSLSTDEKREFCDLMQTLSKGEEGYELDLEKLVASGGQIEGLKSDNDDVIALRNLAAKALGFQTKLWQSYSSHYSSSEGREAPFVQQGNRLENVGSKEHERARTYKNSNEIIQKEIQAIPKVYETLDKVLNEQMQTVNGSQSTEAQKQKRLRKLQAVLRKLEKRPLEEQGLVKSMLNKMTFGYLGKQEKASGGQYFEEMALQFAALNPLPKNLSQDALKDAFKVRLVNAEKWIGALVGTDLSEEEKGYARDLAVNAGVFNRSERLVGLNVLGGEEKAWGVESYAMDLCSQIAKGEALNASGPLSNLLFDGLDEEDRVACEAATAAGLQEIQKAMEKIAVTIPDVEEGHMGEAFGELTVSEPANLSFFEKFLINSGLVPFTDSSN